jgi:thioredoxin-related protein
MVKPLLFTSLMVASLSQAGTLDLASHLAEQSGTNAVVIRESKDIWSVIASINPENYVTVHKYVDTGKYGIQRYEYVVNCQKSTVAMAKFAEIKKTELAQVETNTQNSELKTLSFYSPKLNFDRNVVKLGCATRIALAGKEM